MTREYRLQVLIIVALPLLCFTHCTAQSSGNDVSHPLLVGYFGQGGLYFAQPYYVKALVVNKAADRLDQINYSQGSVRAGRCSLADPDADLGIRFTRQNSVDGNADKRTSRFRGHFHQFEELKHRYPSLKLLISLEGDAQDFARDARPENRVAFVASCVDIFLRGQFAPGISKPGLFDGIDIDWESPEEKDAGNFLALLQEFRRQMNSMRRGLLLSIAVDESPLTFAGTDFAAIAPLVDQVGVMSYDYVGPWSPTTGFLAPLFSDDPQDSHTIEKSIASYKTAGVPSEKLLMGLPFYGYSWTDVEIFNDGLFQRGCAVAQDRSYRDIRSFATNFTAHRDELSQAPWIFSDRTFFTYEDPVSVRFKVSYAVFQHLGGVMMWELSGDTADAELLRTAYSTLHDPLENEIFIEHGRKRRPQEKSIGGNLKH